MNGARFVISLGLGLDIVGVLLMGVWAIRTKAGAIDASLMTIAGETEEENARIPQVKERLRESKWAGWGLFLLVVGFVLQLIGNWMPQ